MDKAERSAWFLKIRQIVPLFFVLGGKPLFQITVGVDIAKNKFDAALLAENKYKHKHFTNDNDGFGAFVTWLSGFGLSAQPLVCMEATGAYGLPLADFLAAKGYPASIVNPAKIHAFARSELSRAKTDNTHKVHEGGRQAHRPLRAVHATRPLDTATARNTPLASIDAPPGASA